MISAQRVECRRARGGAAAAVCNSEITDQRVPACIYGAGAMT